MIDTLVLAHCTGVILGDKITMSVPMAIRIDILARRVAFTMLSLVKTGNLGFKGCLEAKSHQHIFISQMPLTAYYSHLESAHLVVNQMLGPSIAAVTNFVQSTLTNLPSWRLLVPTSCPQ